MHKVIGFCGIVALILCSESTRVWANMTAQNILPDERTPYFSHQSALQVGDKGEVDLDVSIDPVKCDTAQWHYHHAELEVVESRFADVQFVALPEQGCARCPPVRVRWYHEPTGFLSFKVIVYRQKFVTQCR